MTSCNFNSLGVIFGTVLGLSSLAQLSADTKENEPVSDATTLQEEVHLPQHGVALLVPMKDSEVHGMLWLTHTADGLSIQGEVKGLTPGMHGFHIHEFGDLSDREGKSAGGHFNPTKEEHGAPDGEHHHAGDLGNIKANEDGTAKIAIQAPWLKLHFVIGRSFVVHAGADDLKSQPSGNAGGRVAVGVIGIAQNKQTAK